MAGHPYELAIDRSLDRFSHCEFNLLLDNGLLFGHGPKLHECVSVNEAGNLIPVKRCHRMLGVSGTGTKIYVYAGERLVLLSGRGRGFVELTAPPGAVCKPNCISLNGFIGGTFELRGEIHPAIWNEAGELTTDVTPLGSVIHCAPNSDLWFIGFLRGLPAIWKEHRPNLLEVRPGEIVHLDCVNSAGLVGGDVLGHPALWRGDGRRLPFGRESAVGSVRHITEDGCIVLEEREGSRVRFFFGRPDQLIPLEDLLPGEVRGLYVAKVDAVSPSGRMLLTCALDPNVTANSVQVLLAPKALKESLESAQG